MAPLVANAKPLPRAAAPEERRMVSKPWRRLECPSVRAPSGLSSAPNAISAGVGGDPDRLHQFRRHDAWAPCRL